MPAFSVRRVAALDLGEHRGLEALGEAIDADQRRAADRFRVVGKNQHAGGSLQAITGRTDVAALWTI
jgi:hypothetical protein